jgi:hypothetical protein
MISNGYLLERTQEFRISNGNVLIKKVIDSRREVCVMTFGGTRHPYLKIPFSGLK